jgi:hypothetical protein
MRRRGLQNRLDARKGLWERQTLEHSSTQQESLLTLHSNVKQVCRKDTYITGTVDQELLLRNEYLVTENRILRNQITGRVQLTDGERKTLAEIGQKLGKQALKAIATVVTPDTILA